MSHDRDEENRLRRELELMEFRGDWLYVVDVAPIDAGGSRWVAALIGWDEMFYRVEAIKEGGQSKDRVIGLAAIADSRVQALSLLLDRAIATTESS